ncbi:aspartate carbamoyltransferase catalytic subunit [Marivita sp. S0852]|uniref:aspartate carbamoyltransferase catalytic subunit n=1 Tax=Marivita sp. S0852 TaxID=3373893 RepID=UPI003982C9BB
MHIKSSEQGVIRVFHIDLPREAIERFTMQAGTGEWPVQYALGATSLRNAFVEVIDLRDLDEMSLSQYLTSAHDVTGSDFEDMRARLDALKGHVLILPSQAFNQTEQDLNIAPPLHWVGTFNEPRPKPRGAPIESDAAKRSDSTPPDALRPARKRSGPNAGVIIGALLGLALLIIIAKFALF